MSRYSLCKKMNEIMKIKKKKKKTGEIAVKLNTDHLLLLLLEHGLCTRLFISIKCLLSLPFLCGSYYYTPSHSNTLAKNRAVILMSTCLAQTMCTLHYASSCYNIFYCNWLYSQLRWCHMALATF